MPAKKNEVTVETKAEVKKVESPNMEANPAMILAQLKAISYVLRKLKSLAEQHWGVDIDKDGKIGAVRGWVPMAIAASFAIVTLVVGATHTIVDWTAGGPFANGTAKIEFNDSTSNCTFTVDSITYDGDITLENGATIDEATADDVRVTFVNATNGTLGELILESDNPAVTMSDNDLITLKMKAYGENTGMGKQTYGEIQFKVIDVTSNTLDGAVLIRAIANGTTRTLAQFADTVTIYSNTTFAGATVSSSKDTGAVVVEGGVGVEEDVYAGGQIQAAGAITAGTTLNVGTTNIVTYIGNPTILHLNSLIAGTLATSVNSVSTGEAYEDQTAGSVIKIKR